VGDRSVAYEIDQIDATLADGSTSPAQAAGIQAGDRVVMAGGIQDPTSEQLGRVIDEHIGQPVPFTLERGGERIDVTLTPVVDCVDGSWGGVVGVGFASADGPAEVVAVQDELLDGTPTPAATEGIEAGDTFVRIGETTDPTALEALKAFEEGLGTSVPVTIERDGETSDMALVPVRGCATGQESGRLGVILGPVPLSPPKAALFGAVEVGRLTWLSVQEMGRIFGPEGIGRIVTLVFTDEPRTVEDPASLVGVSQQIGQIGQEGRWVDFFWTFAYITLFIGLLNLIPLPPFDGGHLAVLVIEKIRGRKVDPKALVPVSAAVLSFFALFTMAAIALDVWKPIESTLP
jgi:membrane-associated protease RseP (regulator of RpoE activity)